MEYNFLGEFDTEYDNSHSSSENKLTKSFQVTKTSETSFSTQAGINMGIEIGKCTNESKKDVAVTSTFDTTE